MKPLTPSMIATMLASRPNGIVARVKRAEEPQQDWPTIRVLRLAEPQTGRKPEYWRWEDYLCCWTHDDKSGSRALSAIETLYVEKSK